MTSELGPLLRELRRNAGLTQDELAKRSGVAERTIRTFESKPPKDPRPSTLNLMADALELTPEQRRKLHRAARGEPDDDAPAPQAEDDVRKPPGWLIESAEHLAHEVRARWQREEEQRRIVEPFPLPVRWETVHADLSDRLDNIRRVSRGTAAEPLNLTGDLEKIAGIYRSVPSGRLVVLGRAGAGKTVLALRFTLDHLQARTHNDPVPVIFGIGSWDPTAIGLRDWLIEQLTRYYPSLAERAPTGSSMAAALVESDRILPVLDGFDEIARGLHVAAVEAINATKLPFLLTSRPGEYRRSVETAALAAAAGVELAALSRTDLIDYLPRTVRGDAWDCVLDELREHPGGQASTNLAKVLSTPLMVGLARTVYSDTPGSDPADLLDTTRFPTPDVLEEHLLNSFVPAVYRHRPPQKSGSGHRHRNWDPDQALHWLGFLADHLDRLKSETGDLKWWMLGAWLRRSTRILAVVLVSALVTCLICLAFYLPVYLIEHGPVLGAVFTLVDGALGGIQAGLAFGLVHGLKVVYGRGEIEPVRLRVRFRGRPTTVRRGHYFLRFGAGMLGGFAAASAYAPVRTFLSGMLNGHPFLISMTLVNWLVYGLIFGLAFGALLALGSMFGTPLDIDSAATPIAMLAANRSTVLRHVLIFTPVAMFVIAFGGELVVNLLQGLLGPLTWLPAALVTSVVTAICGAFGYVIAFTAWGQWVLLARLWLPMTGRLPWQLIDFLEDAYHRGVLRQTGAVYQFRHERLQHHLGRSFRASNAG